MAALAPTFYAEWRDRICPATRLGEEASAAPPERLLQQIWLHQRLLRDRLAATDGRKLRVIHPGFWNREPGPDFQKAVLQFEGEPARTGDIEIDLAASGWRGHKHDTNPAYRNVILNVLWDGAAAAANLERPRLLLQGCLDAPLPELARWLGAGAESPPEFLPGACAAPLRDVADDMLDPLLRQAALIRFQRKAFQIQARARQSGWEQALWEELLGALGYKHNIWPMRRLAQLAPLNSGHAFFPESFEARLLGLANLLPGELPDAKRAADRHARKLWDYWWRQADGLECVPKSAWRFAGLRPANHPARRLALAAGWSAGGKLIRELEGWLLRTIDDRELADSLAKLLQPPPHEFWDRHWTFRSAPMRAPQALLGEERAGDLAVNVILPWLWVRATAGRNKTLAAEVERRYFAWPPLQDNAVLRLARQRLLGGRATARGAARQQGLIQIVRDFCDFSNAACEQCRFPEMLRALPR